MDLYWVRKRNYIGNYLHGMLGMTGFRLVNAPTFLPAYLHMISGSNMVVGLGLALQQAGGIVSPVIGANLVEHRTKVMPMASLVGGIARLAILGIGVSAWFLKGQALVTAVLMCIGIFGLFMGAQRVVFNVLLSKVIPISRRGRLQAWRNATGGLIAAALAYVAGRYFIQANIFGNGYSTTFALAFVLTSAGLWALRLTLREPEPPKVRPQTKILERLRDFPRVIGENPDYAGFLGVQALATLGKIATPFYVLYVSSYGGLDGKTLGMLSLAYLGADTLSNLVWGYLGDKSGFRIVLLFSLAIWVAATVLLMSVHTPWAVFLAFFGLGGSQSGYMMAAQTMVLEFGSREDVPMRLAISAMAENLTATIGPLTGGLVADAFGYPAVFGISIAVVAAGLLLLILRVKEPRTARLATL